MEPIKSCGENNKNVIYELIQKNNETGQVLNNFKKCIIVPIPKKTTEKTYEQHRTVSLLFHASTFFSRIVLKKNGTSNRGIANGGQI